MKIIMVAAISKDGFLTKGDDPNPGHWTSKEDKEFLSALVKKHSLQIFGSKTYEAYKPTPDPDITRIVLTRSPEKYSDEYVKNQLEFKTLTPQEFIDNYDALYDSCLLLGGGSVYKQFLDANIIDEIYLTVEPVIHGSGTTFLEDGQKLEDLGLPNPTATLLNTTGTKLLHYILKK